MEKELTYEQTIELEQNIQIKNEADKIYSDFMGNVGLDLTTFSGDKFRIWRDEHNAKYVQIIDGKIIYQCRFLHESYDVEVSPSAIFTALKNKYRGVEHMKTDSTRKF